MNKPVLVIMAAGMGSRYGGLKQIDPIGPNGQIILDYSVYDAHRAGFERVVFIIRPELHEAFEQAIGAKARRFMQVDYAYQTLDRLPEGLKAPEGREKPLGTAHAVWCAKELTEGCPIAVINADDFYGADAFRKMYDYLSQAEDDDKFRYCMVGYQVENTLTENGTVSRGVCTEDEHGLLAHIIERTSIHRDADGVIRYDADGDAPAGEIAPGTPVSLNLWGFTPSFLPRRGPAHVLCGEAAGKSDEGRILPAVRGRRAHQGRKGDREGPQDLRALVRRDLSRGQAGHHGCGFADDGGRRVPGRPVKRRAAWIFRLNLSRCATG